MYGYERKAVGDLLIVNDDQEVRELAPQILEFEGRRVRCAATGKETLAIQSRRYRPDTILLNLAMPVMNRWAFRAEQQQRPAMATIPVARLSNKGNVYGDRTISGH